jgi:hypothetical protein
VTARVGQAPAGGAEPAPARASADEPAPGETTAEWSPADWVPDWASEASEPAATSRAAVASETASDAATDTDGGQSGTLRARRARGVTGLRERLAAVRPSRSTRLATLATAATGAGGRGRYERPLPRAVRNAFQAMAKGPLLRAEPLYRDVAGPTGLPWELLAACDWMQCEARPRHSPVHGEKLGTSNADGTAYWTKSAALEQCAEELVALARTVYGIDLTGPGPLSVRDLANAFAAFRWGELLKVHHTSAMEFPYSVAGLTVQHISMRWPTINDPNAPDRPGSRFRMHFGAVPVLLSLDYPATL